MEKKNSEKPTALYAALAGNLVIAVLKYVVAFLAGSSAMLSEAIHSTADTGNELLLLLGLHQSRKPPDREHPLGHGHDLYFWSLIVAVMLFGTGAGSAIYEGVTGLSGRAAITNPLWNYAVLIGVLIANSVSWFLSFRQLNKRRRPGESFWRSLTSSKDPSVFLVFGEDTADIAGVVVAFFGVFLERQLHSHLPDVIASIIIGLILAAVAVFLAYESKSLLIGETADRHLVESVQKLVAEHPAVAEVRRPLSMQLSPKNVFLCLDVQFKPDLRSHDLVRIVDELERRIHQAHPAVGQIFIEIERLKQHEEKEPAGTS